jgi:hypothetical protein
MKPVDRISMGFATAALVVAVGSIVVVAKRETRQVVELPVVMTTVPQDREIATKDLLLLQRSEHATVDHDGVRVIDAALSQRLGLPPGEVITAISGRAIHRDFDLHEVLMDASLAHANMLYVELERDELQALVRWRLDHSLSESSDAIISNVRANHTPPKPIGPVAPIAPAPDDPIAPVIAGITKLDDHHFTITRAAVEALYANLVHVLRGARISPVYRSGGIRLGMVGLSSVYAHLGIASEDEIEDVRGFGTNEIELVMSRGPNPQLITITVK